MGAGASLGEWMRWGGDRSGCRPARNLLFMFLLLLAALGLARTGFAMDPVDIAKPVTQQDLAPFLAGLQTDQASIPIQRPDLRSAPPALMTLEAKGPGPLHNWVAAGFTNSGPQPLSAVFAIPHQGFTGSRFYPARLVGPRVFGQQIAGDGKIEMMPPAPGENAYLLTLPPGGSAAVAFEVTGGVLPATLWQRSAYDGHKDFLSFLRGALLGISVLIALALFSLYGFRSRMLYPVAGGFALSCVAFMLFEAGHLTLPVAQLGLPFLNLQVLRAVIEGLMAGFSSSCCWPSSQTCRASRGYSATCCSFSGDWPSPSRSTASSSRCSPRRSRAPPSPAWRASAS